MFNAIYIYIFKRKLKIKGKNNVVNLTNIKGKYNIRIIGNKNNLNIGKNCKCNQLRIIIRGNNNSISIGNHFNCHQNATILVTGNNNTITLNDKIKIIDTLTIYSHEHANNCSVTIGQKTSFYNTEIYCYDENSSVTIGKDCMFGYNTVLYNTDGHAIFQNGKVINQAHNMSVGNHVWLAQDVTILKNSFIANNTILARNAIISGKFTEKNCILGGTPAKIIKRNIFWSRKTVNQLISHN